MSKFRSLAVLALFAAATACGGAPPGLKIITNPPSAVVFINGELAQDGTVKEHVFDFTRADRACVQAIAAGYLPWIDYWTPRQVESMMRSRDGQTINLTPRRN